MKFGDIHEINSVLQQIQNEEKTKVVESCGCGCGTKEECTCGPECSSCDCHSESVKESDAKPIYDLVGSLGAGKIELADNPIFHDLVRFLDADTIEKFVADFRKNMANESEADDLYHNNVKKVGQKNYNDYKGIQLHNLEKQLNQVFKTLLALTDIEDKDNSSDMVNDLRNMHGALSDLKDAHNNAFEKLNTGRHRTESTNEVAQHGTTEYYRELDKGQLNHTHSILMKTISQLEVAINQRSKFGKELMGNGDRAGTGHLQNMLDKLKVISSEWEEESKLYGN